MTLARLGDESIERYDECEALAFGGRCLSNVGQRRAACRVAHALSRLGVEPGERVVVMVPHRPEVVQTNDGILRAGRVIKCRQGRLPEYKCPKAVRFVDVLPKSPVGTILRERLRSKIGTQP
jgi:acyl-CoA synthetase (AMP-forming)/AMP-acid ligase II